MKRIPLTSIGLAQGIVALLLVVRLVAVFRHQHDIDEAQNLHLVYGWLQGEIPFRDRFDNHAPLFALLFVPLAAIIGETPHVVMLARLALFPVGLGILWLVHRIGTHLASREIAWWTVAITLALADWSLKSVEFRPDVVWAFFWFLAVWLLVRHLPSLRPRHAIPIGLALGLALCTSIKTSFLIPALAIGCVAALTANHFLGRRKINWRAVLAGAALAGAAIALPPCLLFGWFIAQGTSVETLQFCLFSVNKLPFDLIRVGLAVALGPFVLAGGWLFFRQAGPASTARGILFIATGAYLLALFGFAPELRKQTFLPAYPIVVLFACLIGFSTRLPHAVPRIAAAATCLAAAIHLITEFRPWHDGLADHRQLLTNVLALTDPGDYLIDNRGETIFVDRPVYLTYVDVTVRKMTDGQLPAPDTNQLITPPTSLAIGSLTGLPKSLRDYLKLHYLAQDNGQLRAAGKILKPSFENGNWIAYAEIPLPGQYVIVKDGQVTEQIPITTPGPQTFNFGPDRRRATLIWQNAWTKGFRPSEE